MSEPSGSTFAILHAIANTGDITGIRVVQVARNVIEITDEMNRDIATLRKENEELKAKLDGELNIFLDEGCQYKCHVVDTLKARLQELEELFMTEFNCREDMRIERNQAMIERNALYKALEEILKECVDTGYFENKVEHTTAIATEALERGKE